MKKVLLLFSLFCATASLLFYRYHSQSEYPRPLSRNAFDASIGVDRFGKDFVFEKDLDKQIGELAHELISLRRKEWKEPIKRAIPLSIHQVWIGSETIPDDLARGAQLVKTFHKDIPYTLWTQKEYEPLLVEALGKSRENVPHELLKEVVSALIVLKHGGVVIDLKTECVQSIVPLLSLGDCIIGFNPPSAHSHFQRRLMLSPVVIAAAPAHPLIKEWLAEMLRRALIRKPIKQKKFHLWAVEESLTSVVASQGKTSGRPLLVGPTYFCPVAPSHIAEFQAGLDGYLHRSTLKKILQSLHILAAPPYSDVTHETIIVHIKKQLETKKEGC